MGRRKTMNEIEIKDVEYILDFLIYKVHECGGDGWGTWYTKFLKIKNIYPVVKNWNNKQKFPMDIKIDEKAIHLSDGEESLCIIDDKQYLDFVSKENDIILIY